MRIFKPFIFLLSVLLGGVVSASHQTEGLANAPIAKKVPITLEKHGHKRVDNYFWLKNRDDPEVIDYLQAENKYTEQMMAHTKELTSELYKEIKGRIKQTDMSVPYKDGDYYYYSRFEDEKAYPIYCRKTDLEQAPEEILLDVNLLAEGHDFFEIGMLSVSTDGKLLAYAEDTKGRRIYTIKFKNLITGKELTDVIDNVTGNLEWANDNKTVFYARADAESLRSYQILRHKLGAALKDDKLIYQEDEDTFHTYILKTKSKKYLMIGSFQTVSSEYRILDADVPNGEFRVFLPRQRDHEYDIEHFQDKFYIRTNLQAKNFRLMATPVTKTSLDNWQEIIPHREDTLLENFEVFDNFLVLEQRKNGLVQLNIRPWNINSWDNKNNYNLDFEEDAYLAYIGKNVEMSTDWLRFGYTSMTTPDTIYDYNMLSKEKVLKKRQEVLGGFKAENYKTERVYARASDGTKIPISLFYRPDVQNQQRGYQPKPLLLYGYGSYGHSLDATFVSTRLSLVDRGFVYAIAHVRGGEDLGRAWYEDGKLLQKKNTFQDFITCAEYLVQEKYAQKNHLYAMGGSAGGLLMGAIVNLRPDLFKAVVTQVPFVDVITTMLDSSIPLTTGEYDEWGDPGHEHYYNYILSYSPYDNVEAKNYPHMLVTTGLHDSQVQYWEPAKWVAKLRDVKTDQNKLLLKTNMVAGHGGASGRYERYKEIAFEYAFVLDLLKKNS
jgi:oligopeptidase B